MSGTSSSPLLHERGVTRREADVLAALADRLPNADIAARLYLSERTVESHVTSLLRKLGARNRVELGDLAKKAVGEDQALPSHLPAPLALMAESSPFVARASELARLRALWARAAKGRMLVGLVAGEAGMGKSRLVAELAAGVHEAGAQVMQGACFEEVPVPYQPFVQAISADVASLPRSELRRRVAGSGQLGVLVPELVSDAPAVATEVLDPVTAQAELFGALHGYLVRAAQRGPLLVVVEDAHWATNATLGALRHLARVSGHAPILVVVTTRDKPPDMHGELSVVLSDLERLPSVERIDLAGLDETEVAALLETLGAQADPAAVHAMTGGNPLFVREVAGAAQGRGGTLRGLLARRFALLSKHDLDVLDMAAVIGTEFLADVLATAVRYPLPIVLESLERAEASGIVARSPFEPGHFSFVHALFRAVRYDDIPAERRMELHGQIAGALRERADDERVLPELARHASMATALDDRRDGFEDLMGPADLAERARRALRDVGDRALGLNDFAAAALAYEGAVKLWPVDDPERPGLLLSMGRALFTAERTGAAVLTEARDGLLAVGDDEGAAEADMMLGELEWISSRWDAASVHFGRAATLVADRPPSPKIARVVAGLAKFRMIAGDNRGARNYGNQALEMARTLGLPPLEADALVTVGPVRVADGDLGGIDDLKAGIALAERMDTPVLARACANLSYVFGVLGDVRRCNEWRQRAREAAERFGLAEHQRWARAHDLEYWFHVGRWDDALAGADSFLADAESSSHYLVTVCLRVRACVRLGRGNRIGALADGAAAVEFARGASHPSNLLVALPFYARCLYECGRVGDADAAASEALKAAAGNEYLLEPIETAIVLYGLGRQADLSAVAARIPIASKRRDVSRIIADGDLEQAADMLDHLAHRSFSAYVRMMAAERLLDHGRRSDAERQIRQALAFHRSVGATAYVERGERLVAALH